MFTLTTKVKVSAYLGCFCLSIFALGSELKTDQQPQQLKLAEDVEVQELLPGIWLHTTYMDLQNFRRVGANGLIVIEGQQAIMIDLPWKNEQTGVLFDWVKKKYDATIQTVVPTHSHIDCAGGLEEAHRRGADSIALDKTIEFMKKEKAPLAKRSFIDKMDIQVGGTKIELLYMGGGHTSDNIIAWIPDRNVLFAGCVLKGLDFRSIGNTADADLSSYPKTLEKMRQRFKKALLVVPGHGEPGGPEIIDHTENMLNQHLEQHN